MAGTQGTPAGIWVAVPWGCWGTAAGMLCRWGTAAGMRGCCAAGVPQRGRGDTLLAPEQGSGHAAPRWLLALLSHLLFFFPPLFLCARKAAKQIKDRYGTLVPPPSPTNPHPPPSQGPCGCWGGSAHSPRGHAGQGVSSQGWVGVWLPAPLTLVPTSPTQRDDGTRLPPLAQGQGERQHEPLDGGFCPGTPPAPGPRLPARYCPWAAGDGDTGGQGRAGGFLPVQGKGSTGGTEGCAGLARGQQKDRGPGFKGSAGCQGMG